MLRVVTPIHYSQERARGGHSEDEEGDLIEEEDELATPTTTMSSVKLVER